MNTGVFDATFVDATNYSLPLSSLRLIRSRLFSDSAIEMSLAMSLVASVFRVRRGSESDHIRGL
jgi:hypothetical protein